MPPAASRRLVSKQVASEEAIRRMSARHGTVFSVERKGVCILGGGGGILTPDAKSGRWGRTAVANSRGPRSVGGPGSDPGSGALSLPAAPPRVCADVTRWVLCARQPPAPETRGRPETRCVGCCVSNTLYRRHAELSWRWWMHYSGLKIASPSSFRLFRTATKEIQLYLWLALYVYRRALVWP